MQAVAGDGSSEDGREGRRRFPSGPAVQHLQANRCFNSQQERCRLWDAIRSEICACIDGRDRDFVGRSRVLGMRSAVGWEFGSAEKFLEYFSSEYRILWRLRFAEASRKVLWHRGLRRIAVAKN